MITGLLSPKQQGYILPLGRRIRLDDTISAFGKQLKYSFPWYGKYPSFDQQFEDLWTEEEKQEIYKKPWEYIK